MNSRGLGDTVKEVLHRLRVDKLLGECHGCKNRQNLLNKAVPYKNDKPKVVFHVKKK